RGEPLALVRLRAEPVHARGGAHSVRALRPLRSDERGGRARLPRRLHGAGDLGLRPCPRPRRAAWRLGMKMRLRKAAALAATVLVASICGAQGAAAQQAPAKGAEPSVLHIGYLRFRIEPRYPHSFVEIPPKDDGIAGAR